MSSNQQRKFGLKRFFGILAVLAILAAGLYVAGIYVKQLNLNLPGQKQSAKSVKLPAGCASIAAGLDWSGKPASFNGPVARTPPMGFSSYPLFDTAISQQQIISIANKMASNGMEVAGYRYIYIDDGWQGRRVNGVLTANHQRFPCGIKLVADYLHSKGFKLGLYTTPGKTSCGGNIGSYGHTDTDVATFASWGVDAIKLDWCNANYAQAEIITEQWHNAIVKSGRAMVLSINAGGNPVTGTWAQYYANEWRTSDDICPSWFNKTQPHAAGAVQCYGQKYQSGVFDYLTSSDTQANALNVGPGHWADPDALEAGNTGLSSIEAQTQFSIWCMWSAPLIIGGDPRNMPTADLQTLVNPYAIAIDQDALGVMAHLAVSSPDWQVWIKPLTNQRVAVAVVNLGDSPDSYKLNWPSLGLSPDTVYDIWSGTNPNYTPKNLTISLSAHATALLLVY